MPVFSPFRVDLITQSTASIYRKEDITQLCRTPDFTRKLVSVDLPTVHLKLEQKALIQLTISVSIPQCLKIFQRLSLWILSKAFSKSIKLMINCLCHSVHCSMMFLSTNTWSQQPFPFLKPACSRSLLSTAVFILAMIILLKILLGIESKVIPLQLLQLVRSPFFGNMMMSPSNHVVCMISLSHILQTSGWRISADRAGSNLNTSAGN